MAEKTFGPWKYNTESMLLTHTTERYEVPFDEFTTSAQALDWIMQVATKTWADDATLAGLLRAVDDVLDPQASLCSQGIERGPVKWRQGTWVPATRG